MVDYRHEPPSGTAEPRHDGGDEDRQYHEPRDRELNGGGESNAVTACERPDAQCGFGHEPRTEGGAENNYESLSHNVPT